MSQQKRGMGMKTLCTNYFMLRLTLLIAPIGIVDRANAACAPVSTFIRARRDRNAAPATIELKRSRRLLDSDDAEFGRDRYANVQVAGIEPTQG